MHGEALILEEGVAIFYGGRRGVDLKDKHRNLVKKGLATDKRDNFHRQEKG